MKSDKNVENVREMLLTRMNRGIEKYNTTTERTDLSIYDWLVHAQEEALDFAVYLERLKHEFKNTISSNQ